MKKIILIDGNSLVYRAFFALPTNMVNSQGQVTNAVYGFTSMLIKLIKDERPDVLITAFDKGKANFRHEEYEDYKAHRQPTPDDLISQFPLVKELLNSLNIPVCEMSGFEADDILATLASQAEASEHDVIVVTGDRDAFQMVDDHIKVMTTRKGISDIVIYDRVKVEEKYGITPEQVADYLALKGDTSDNIPGVPGFGEKTAAKLIQQFGSLENLLDNIDKIENKRWRSMIEENIEEAKMSKRLATLDRNVPIDVNLDECKLGDWDEEKVREIFSKLEMPSLLTRLLGRNTQNGSATSTSQKNSSSTRDGAGLIQKAARVGKDPMPSFIPYEVETVQLSNDDNLYELVGLIENNNRFSLTITTDCPSGIDMKTAAIGVSVEYETGKLKSFYFSEPEQMLLDFGEETEDTSSLSIASILDSVKPYMEDKSKIKYCHDAKRIMLAMRNSDINPQAIGFDTMIAAYLISPEKTKYLVGELAAEYLDLTIPDATTIDYLAHESAAIFSLVNPLEHILIQDSLLKLFEDIEMPLIGILADMEEEGVNIDVAYLADLSKELELMLQNIESEIFSLAGQEFNVGSPQQLGFVLFEKLGLPKSKKTKTGYSTDANVLAKLINVHPIVEKIIAFRELAKLKSTYVDALPKLINRRTGRLHTSFNQTVTTTGRLSSSNPNLQNIPVRTELGQRIRQAFVPPSSDKIFVSADYSQIELRLLAHYSGEEVLIKAFQEDRDIHEATAMEVYGTGSEEVTPQMRRIAKMVNFGVLYGMSAYGLSDRLGIPVSDAKTFIDRYFNRLPKVEAFINNMLAEATREGYVETLLGRRRYIPELSSTNRQVRALGERFAVNAPLQGTAADIIKLAMIAVDRELREQNLETKMILQVHDELIFVVPESERELCINLVKSQMENAYPLRIKLKVTISEGNNWKDAK